MTIHITKAAASASLKTPTRVKSAGRGFAFRWAGCLFQRFVQGAQFFEFGEAACGVPCHEAAGKPLFPQRADLVADLLHAVFVIGRLDGIIRLNPSAVNCRRGRFSLPLGGGLCPVEQRLIWMLPRAVGPVAGKMVRKGMPEITSTTLLIAGQYWP